VVKRIGDELMVTFKDLAGAECFVDSPVTDTVLQTYQYKIAVDFGSAYHFRFVEHLADDPYGPVVDRCARIAKYAGPSTVICSRAYRNRVANPAAYVSIGNFALRGWLPVAGAHPKVVGSDGADLRDQQVRSHLVAQTLHCQNRADSVSPRQ
jgi:class 3 adenylate cyclase